MAQADEVLSALEGVDIRQDQSKAVRLQGLKRRQGLSRLIIIDRHSDDDRVKRLGVSDQQSVF